VVRVDSGLDRVAARLAATQQGRVTRAQLTGLGFTREAIAHRLKTGRLHRVRHGVYAVGHLAAMPLGDEVAALLSCGDGAVLSHRSAAKVWELPVPADPLIDVTVIGRACGGRHGVRLHRVPFLDAVDLRHHHGIALTAPARTILDLAADLTIVELERVIAEALVRKLLTRKRSLAPTSSECSSRSSAPPVSPSPTPTCASMATKWTRCGASTGSSSRSTATASTRLAPAFERDRRKDADLQDAGYRVLRITWLQLEREPYLVIARLARALESYAA
jgi:hypothetical protein